MIIYFKQKLCLPICKLSNIFSNGMKYVCDKPTSWVLSTQ